MTPAPQQDTSGRRKAHAQARDRVRKLERISAELGARLARLPDDAVQGRALTKLFHSVQNRLHQAEAREYALRPGEQVRALSPGQQTGGQA